MVKDIGKKGCRTLRMYALVRQLLFCVIVFCFAVLRPSVLCSDRG